MKVAVNERSVGYEYSHPPVTTSPPASQSAISTLRQQGETLHIVPQNLYEFWAVATRPVGATNGLGLTIAQTKAEMARIRSLFVMLPDTPTIYAEWEQRYRSVGHTRPSRNTRPPRRRTVRQVASIAQGPLAVASRRRGPRVTGVRPLLRSPC
jgi:hypothetical protein